MPDPLSGLEPRPLVSTQRVPLGPPCAPRARPVRSGGGAPPVMISTLWGNGFREAGEFTIAFKTVGAPLMWVTPWRAIWSNITSGEGLRMQTLVPPRAARPQTRHQPLQWNIGTTGNEVIPWTNDVASAFKYAPRWLYTTPFVYAYRVEFGFGSEGDEGLVDSGGNEGLVIMGVGGRGVIRNLDEDGRWFEGFFEGRSGGGEEVVVGEEDLGLRVAEEGGDHGRVVADDGSGHGNGEVELHHGGNVGGKGCYLAEASLRHLAWVSAQVNCREPYTTDVLSLKTLAALSRKLMGVSGAWFAGHLTRPGNDFHDTASRSSDDDPQRCREERFFHGWDSFTKFIEHLECDELHRRRK
ncbi:DNA mismatch repair protein MutS [Striga asiatica]|uniref:DNA mismatch repair protein MutS n=1 Tax=Striga asiatica TaxID=4170 RepID=A0A5A7QGE6_STRAF|nr:DNA mismatch repair protein MutS [Striga asiatica]